MSNALLLSCSRWPRRCSRRGCGRKETPNRAVATPTLTLSKERVPIGSPLTLTYKFVVAPNAKFDKDYWVFVHFLDPKGEQMWTDDHLPPMPTTTWKPGETIEYTRTVFVPNYPYIGRRLVRLGLYDRRPTASGCAERARTRRGASTWSPSSSCCRSPRTSS